MPQLNSGQRLPDQVLNMGCGTDLHQLRHFLNDGLFTGLGAHRQVHPRIYQIFVMIDCRGVNRFLRQLQRQRHQVGGHDSFKQGSQLLIEFRKNRSEGVMHIERQIARPQLLRKSCERSAQRNHRGIQFFGMSHLAFV